MNAANAIRKTVTISLIMLCTGLMAQGQKQIQFKDLTFDQAMKEAAKTNKVIFVDVVNNHISPMAQRVDDSVFSMDKIVDYFKEHVIAIRINMSTEEGKKFIPRLAMLMYPVYVFHDKNGDQLSFINAAQILKNPESLMETAKNSVATAHQKEVNTRHIEFDKNSKWNALLAKARKENKLIFIDAYTVWCRPCIQMARDVFTLDKVADFYNKNFINVSMDMEKGEGPGLAKKYEVAAYPAFLFINGKGELVHRDGGFMEAPSFINVGEKALEKMNQ